MTTARILTIDAINPIPKADRLMSYRVLGYDAVSANLADGSPRFAVGERVVYVAEGCKIPENLLKEHGFWGIHPTKKAEMGLLSGPDGDVVKPATLRGSLSTGLLWKLPPELAHLPDTTDVSEHFGITEWIPPLDPELLKIAMPVQQAKLDYQIGRLKTYPTFLEGMEVVITEKLEGECLQLTWLGNDVVDGLHGDGRIAIATKGLGRQGLAFRDCEASERVPVIRAVRNTNILHRFTDMIRLLGLENETVQLILEAIGPGIKKLHYGQSKPSVRGLDCRVGQRWLPEDELDRYLSEGGIERAPVLWRGTYNATVVESLREGNTTLDANHIREGIVIKAVGEQDMIQTDLDNFMRPILKTHCDVFLRKFGQDD